MDISDKHIESKIEELRNYINSDRTGSEDICDFIRNALNCFNYTNNQQLLKELENETDKKLEYIKEILILLQLKNNI